jgi:hypothetical protein
VIRFSFHSWFLCGPPLAVGNTRSLRLLFPYWRPLGAFKESASCSLHCGGEDAVSVLFPDWMEQRGLAESAGVEACHFRQRLDSAGLN